MTSYLRWLTSFIILRRSGAHEWTKEKRHVWHPNKLNIIPYNGSDALYNVVLGQTVLPNWRKLEAVGPFAAENPPTPEDVRTRHEQKYPGVQAFVWGLTPLGFTTVPFWVVLCGGTLPWKF